MTTLTETHRSDYQDRVMRYQQFAAGVRRIGVPLYTVEMVRPGTGFVTGDDGTNVRIERASAPHLWQKEHLLNCLIARLPYYFDAIAWLDADVLYEHDAWAAAAEIAMEKFAAVQMFEKIHWLNADGSTLATFRACTDSSFYGSREIQVAGFGWCARRSLLEATGGLYARGGAGSNDAIMATAYCPLFNLIDYAAGNSRSALRWIRTAKKSGPASCLKGHTLQHLWHGSLKSRGYSKWDRDLIDAGYDADRDPIFHDFEITTSRVDLNNILRRHGCI